MPTSPQDSTLLLHDTTQHVSAVHAAPSVVRPHPGVFARAPRLRGSEELGYLPWAGTANAHRQRMDHGDVVRRRRGKPLRRDAVVAQDLLAEAAYENLPRLLFRGAGESQHQRQA